MSSQADIVALVRALLQDEDARAYVWPTSLLNALVDKGVRRLSPHCFRRVVVTVEDVGETEYTLADYQTDVYEVEAVITDDVVGEWDVYGGTLTLEYAPTNSFKLRCAVKYADASELPEDLADAVADYAASKALQYLLNRGGEALQRYLSAQGLLDGQELVKVFQDHYDEFLLIRDEHSRSSVVRY